MTNTDRIRLAELKLETDRFVREVEKLKARTDRRTSK